MDRLQILIAVRLTNEYFSSRSVKKLNCLATVDSLLADTSLLRTLAITDKIQIPIYKGLTGNDSRYYGPSLFRTQNNVPKVSAITRVEGTRQAIKKRKTRKGKKKKRKRKRSPDEAQTNNLLVVIPGSWLQSVGHVVTSASETECSHFCFDLVDAFIYQIIQGKRKFVDFVTFDAKGELIKLTQGLFIWSRFPMPKSPLNPL